MFSKNIPQYTLDFTGKRIDNLVEGEYYRKIDTTTDDGTITNDITFVLRSGPFYTDSLILTKPNGELLIEGTHYEIFGIATALTAFIKDKEVGMFVNIIDDSITEWFARYQVVGHFGVMNQDLVDLVNTAVNDDRPIYYKNIRNRPKWFNPELHLHDLRYAIHSFQDLVDGIKSIRELKGSIVSRESIAVEQFNTIIMGHIDDFEKMLLSYIRQHDSENVEPYGNSHGLTAEQMKLEKVDNFETATLLDIIDGFRKDKHITVDLVKRAVDQIGKDTDNLVKIGTLPLLRYGSNSFIPSPIQGSFEGMGGDNFFVGTNIESNGDALILMNRNDGRTNGLYFMRNSDPNIDQSKWVFTAYKYEHQTASADGVSLSYILRGSNGKFLIVGGLDSNNKLVWYYSLGNGTLDPAKHKLIRIPDSITIGTHDSIITESYPDRVLLVQRVDCANAVKNDLYRNNLFDLPEDKTSFTGVSFSSSFFGLKIWDFSLSDGVWRKATLTYNQVDETRKMQVDLYAPFRFVVKKVSDQYPRADGKTQYGLSQFEYKFTHMLTWWNIRDWFGQTVALYESTTDKLYCKFIYTSYGYDERPLTHEGRTSSIGFVLKNRKVTSEGVSYDVENRKSLTKMYTLNTQTSAGVSKNIVSGEDSPHSEWTRVGYTGHRTNGWFSSKKWFTMGSAGYGSFPASMSINDFSGMGSVENLNNWVDDRMDANLGGVSVPTSYNTYNELNPANLSIGGHSTFWLQLDPSNPNTYGSVSLIYNNALPGTGLLFRKQPALNKNGYPIKPTKTYNLYKELAGGNLPTIGYDLENETYPINNHYSLTFVTNIFAEGNDNRKSEYCKHLIAHQPFKGLNTTVNNTNCNTIFEAEHEIVADGKGYIINATKKYELATVIKNTLIPYLEKNLPLGTDGQSVSYVNALGSHRIGFTNLRSNKYKQPLIFMCYCFDNSGRTTKAFASAVCFDLTGGTVDSEGIIQGATATIIGSPKINATTTIRTDLFNRYLNANVNFERSIGKTVTMSRDLVMQMDNGLSHVNMQSDIFFTVVGNNDYPGISFLVSEEGIVDIKNFTSYWTSGEFRWFHHPYYGCVNRQGYGSYPRRSNGSAEVGLPYNRNFTTMAEHTIDPSFWVLGNSNYLSSAFSIYFSSEQDVIMSGKEYTIPSEVQDLKDIVLDPRNKTFYIYLDYGSSGPYYHIVLTPLSETPNRGLISIVKTNNDSIYSIENQNVFTMNGIRISTIRHGSVIPAAAGGIDDQGQLEGWVTKNR